MTLEPTVVALADRLIILAAGVAIAWMGYRLLASGLYEHATDLKDSSLAGDLLWKQTLPGTMFTLFSGVIIVVGLRQPVLFTDRKSDNQNQVTYGEREPSEPETPSWVPEAGSLLPAVPEAGSLLPLSEP